MKTYTMEQLRNYEVERETVGEPDRLMLFTSGCDNNCLFCFSKKAYPFSKEIAINLIDKYYSAGILHLAGGEPTLCPFIEDLIRYAKSKGMIVCLMTNARRLSDCQFLGKLIDAGLDKVVISFRSHLKEVHNEITKTDSFGETMMGIHNCVTRGLNTQLMLIVNKKNYLTIDDTIRIMCSLNPTSISVESLIFSGNSIENFGGMAVELSEVAPYLETGLDILIESGIPFSVNSFPLCLFKEKYWDYFGNSKNQITATNFKFKGDSELVTSGLAQADKCRECSENYRCPGTWETYYSIYGDEKFNPIKKQG